MPTHQIELLFTARDRNRAGFTRWRIHYSDDARLDLSDESITHCSRTSFGATAFVNVRREFFIEISLPTGTTLAKRTEFCENLQKTERP